MDDVWITLWIFFLMVDSEKKIVKSDRLTQKSRRSFHRGARNSISKVRRPLADSD